VPVVAREADKYVVHGIWRERYVPYATADRAAVGLKLALGASGKH
jgi:hypothetical protein